MAVRLGKYAALRPDPESSLTQQISLEYKRDLMEENVDVFGNALGGKSKSDKKRKKSKKNSSDSDSSNSESEASSGEKKKKKRKKRKKERKTKDGEERGSKDRDRDRSESRARERERNRNESGDAKKKKKAPVREPTPESSYHSPSNLEDDSDLESNGLDLKYDLEPLIHHLHLDREIFNKQVFRIIRGRRRRHLLPKILRDMNEKDLKQACLEELATWSNKRLRVLMRTGELLSAETKGALIDPSRIFEQMKKRDEITALREKIQGDALAAGEKMPKEEELPDLNESARLDKDGSESEEEDIEAMRANLEKWRKAKFEEELQKMKDRHAKETEELKLVLEEELKMLDEQLEAKEESKKKLDELNKKMEEVRKKMAQKEADKRGMVLVEKSTLKKKKPVEEALPEEGPVPLEPRSSDDADSSLDMDDIEASNSNQSVGDGDKPKVEMDKAARKKARKEKKKKQQEDDIAAGQVVGPKANLCPDVPYKPKKDRRQIVKDWLANIGADGPPLPVPEENYYPEYCDPNTKNAEEEIQKLQDAYDTERSRKGRTDGKIITKITGEQVFEDDSEDDEDTKNQNAIAKRMLTTMLNRSKPKTEKKEIKTEAGKSEFIEKDSKDGLIPRPGMSAAEMKKLANGGVDKNQNSTKTKTEALGAIYQRSGDNLGKLQFAKDAVRDKIVAGRLKQEAEHNQMGGYTAEALKNNKDVKFKDQSKVKTSYELRREQQQKMETEMRAKAIKSMMEKMQKKKVKQEQEDKKAQIHEGAFPWQDDYVDDDMI